MRYETIKHLKDTDFKRLTGVQRETFEKMLAVVEKDLRDFGRPPKLSRADQLLIGQSQIVIIVSHGLEQIKNLYNRVIVIDRMS